MSWLSDAFSNTFSSSGANKLLKKGYAEQDKNNKEAKKNINVAAKSATTALNTGKTDATAALNQGNAAAQQAISSGVNTGQNQLTQGANTAAGYLQQGLTPWQQLSQAGQAGIDAYGNLLGLGGADMQANLEKIPGYQFALDQGLQGLDRAANARGMLKSGNNTIDILKFAQGLANQNYFNYLQGFQPYFGLGQNAASGLASGYTNLGNLFNQLGQNQAGLTQWGAGQSANSSNQLGANLSNVDTGTANQLANNYQWQGGNLADVNTGQGNQANNYYTNVANANQAAAGNTWNALLNGAKLAAGAYAA